MSRPGTGRSRATWTLLGAAIVLALVVLAPPVGLLARRYVVAETVQFAVLAVIVPVLVVVSAPWSGSDHLLAVTGAGPGRERARLPFFARVATARRRHRSPVRSIAYLAAYLAAVIGWRIPPSVDALRRIAGLSLLEAATLLVLGVLLWLEIVVSPPFVPRSAYPMRLGVTVVAMWITWMIGYLLGFSHVSWYHAYVHTPSSGLSLIADQQLAAGALWVIPAMAYLPAVLSNLMAWLKDSEDPDDEMRQLLRAERRLTWGRPPEAPDRADRSSDLGDHPDGSGAPRG